MSQDLIEKLVKNQHGPAAVIGSSFVNMSLDYSGKARIEL